MIERLKDGEFLPSPGDLVTIDASFKIDLLLPISPRFLICLDTVLPLSILIDRELFAIDLNSLIIFISSDENCGYREMEYLYDMIDSVAVAI